LISFAAPKMDRCRRHVIYVYVTCVVLMQAVHKHMQLEVNRLKWEHAQEIAELRHNAGQLFSALLLILE